MAIDEITQHIVYDYLTPTNGYMSEYRCERLLTKYGCHTFWTMPSICRVVCSYQSSRCAQKGAGHGSLARYLKLRVAHAPGITGTFSPPPRVSNPDMHHGTCVTHVPWCIPGLLTSGFIWGRWQENISNIPSARATRKFSYLVRGPWIKAAPFSQKCSPCSYFSTCFHLGSEYRMGVRGAL